MTLPDSPTVVLVHGAFADASGWAGVISELQAAGLTVVAPPNPLRGAAADAAHIASVVDQIEGPVLLVAHSYGGVVISGAAAQAADVVGLVFVTGFALEVGESILDLNGRFPDTLLGPALRPSTFPVPGGEPGTEMAIDPAQFHDVFGADLPATMTDAMAVSQRPCALDGFTIAVDVAGWKDLPTWYVVAAADQAIHPDAQRAMAERAGATTVEVEGSHAVATSQPAAVAAVIVKAAAATLPVGAR